MVGTACSGNIFSLTVGDCFDDWESSLEGATQEVSDVPIVDCSEPHDNEVYSVSEIAGGAFPGDTTVQDLTIERCTDTFEPLVGKAYADSQLDFGAFFPTAATWADGDREVMCFLWQVDFEKLEGTMQGSGI